MEKRTRTLTICLGILLGLLSAHSASAQVQASYLYSLANFSGPLPSIWAKVAVDPEVGEVYALNTRKNNIRIFNESGMETFSFGEGFGSTKDITAGDDGDIFLLTGHGQAAAIHRCNYRGELIETLTLKDIPKDYSDFATNQLAYRNESLYLIDAEALLILIVDKRGNFKEAHDLKSTMRRLASGDSTLKRALKDISFGGFDVDQHGNMLFTTPSLFSAFRLSPDGELQRFGRPGSASGKFGVVGGITSDDIGHIYVSDRLRNVVLIFNKNLHFLAEFGYSGWPRSNLVAPNDLAIDRNGRLYVAQAANRGVSVFKVIHERSSSTDENQVRDSSLERARTEADQLQEDE